MLKKHLFSKHSQIQYLGKSWPEFGNTDYCNNDTNLEILRRSVRGSVEPAIRGGLVPVMSRPRLAYRDHSILAEHMVRVFGPSKIMVVVRHPLRWVESFHLHTLRMNTLSWNSNRPRAAGFIELEDYLTRLYCRSGKPRSRLRCIMTRNILEPYVSRLGKENVGVFMFEHLQTDSKAFIESVSKFIGVDPVEGVLCAEKSHSNPRLTRVQVDRMKEIHHSSAQTKLFRLGTRKDRRRLIGASHTKDEKATVEIPAPWRTKIENLARDDCNYLRQEWGLPVYEAGYPL